MAEKPLLLYISAHLPSLSFPQAGHKTAYSILKEYSVNFDIIAVFFLNAGENKFYREEDYGFLREIHIFRINYLTRLAGLVMNPFMPVNGAIRKNRKAARLILRLENDNTFSAVHFEFTAAACYLNYIKPGIWKIYSEHDLTWQALERKLEKAGGLKRLLLRFEFIRQKKWELLAIRRMDEVLVHNGKDKGLLLRENISGPVIKVIKPYINPAFKEVKRGREERGAILFWGAMDRAENSDAAGWFIKDIFPGIISGFPGARLYIVGANPGESLKKSACGNIVVTGFVEDPLPYFEKACLAVAPLRLGAGVKVKVLEALSAGLPVVATGIGGEGISDPGLIIADDPEEFIKEVLGILGSHVG
jgi:glycosyltransferase involved in cell wall biosynthesis